VVTVVVAGLTASGFGLQRLVSPAWADWRRQEPALLPANLLQPGAQGLVLALLGGVSDARGQRGVAPPAGALGAV